ncbi:MAG TPA: hypothetical protein VGG19_08620 [Tepidisphaeraceae bacterium]
MLTIPSQQIFYGVDRADGNVKRVNSRFLRQCVTFHKKVGQIFYPWQYWCEGQTIHNGQSLTRGLRIALLRFVANNIRC